MALILPFWPEVKKQQQQQQQKWSSTDGKELKGLHLS
jgi:hypothetical protein